MRTHLETVAAEVGLTMKQRDVIINSRRALGAAEFAREHDRFDAMHLALLKAHWEGTGRLENVDDLVRIGTEVGLDPAELRSAIEEDRYAVVIDENRAEATRSVSTQSRRTFSAGATWCWAPSRMRPSFRSSTASEKKLPPG